MKKINMALVIMVVILSLFGLMMVYSSSYVWAEYKFDDPFNPGMISIRIACRPL